MYLHDKKTPKPAKNPKHIFLLAIVSLVVIALVLLPLLFLNKTATKDQAKESQEASATPVFNKKQFSTTDPTSPWVVVNKKNPISPKDFSPELKTPDVPLRLSAGNTEMQVNPQTAEALEKMFAAAKQENINLMLASGYRSYNLQISVYNSEVKAYGQAAADRESARPSFSEHQTGWALDVEPSSKKCEIAACFADTPEGQWLAANAYKYGFIIRYTSDKEDVTGYKYEPWHIRYVGTDLSQEMKNKNIATLEEFFNIPGGASY
jgi:D-alanyl-D-alanine carboxypeptidase